LKNQTKNDQTKPPPEAVVETPSVDDLAVEPASVDAKELARQRSKDDLARKRRDMHQKRGKR
jgi:hypothetical protein